MQYYAYFAEFNENKYIDGENFALDKCVYV